MTLIAIGVHNAFTILSFEFNGARQHKQ